MPNRVLAATATVAAALALTVTTSGSAQASIVSGYRGCVTTGASGGYDYSNYHGPDAKVAIKFNLSDTASDGHHVRIRFISKNVNGTIKYWAWRSNLDGAHTTKYWSTTAADSSGLFDIGVQVARFKGNTVLNACADW
ncbi:hypothetical protein OHT93_17220 [Streptomyces sp. NBC_00191]|uniref:hypothetical protein n=1 Tax=Streptomyces sp. NBC_00191 TaxID=2975674 RepID=UPI003254BB7F